nr:hypothetical protein [Tanacetum cinerariifolium]
MATYCEFTACDVPKFDGTLEPIASTRWLSATEGAFRTSNCKKKNKVNFALNFLRDSAQMWWEGKFDEALELISSTRWLSATEGAFHTSNCKEKNKVNFALNFLRDSAQMWWEGKVYEKGEEWIVNELWKKFNNLTRYCLEYHGNEKLKVERFQRMLCDDIQEAVSLFKCTTLDDLLSRARMREVDLLRKKNK